MTRSDDAVLQRKLPLRPPRRMPWFWRLYALRLERELMLANMRIDELEKNRGAR